MRTDINMPAALVRRRCGTAAPEGVETVARGPLIVMAYGMRAIPLPQREEYWIRSAAGDFTASEAEETLRRWTSAPDDSERRQP